MTTSNQSEGKKELHLEVISIPRARAYWMAVDELGALGVDGVGLELVGKPGDSLRVDTSARRAGFVRMIGVLAESGSQGDGIEELQVPEGKVAIAVVKAADFGSLGDFYRRTNRILNAHKHELKAIVGIDDLLTQGS